MSNQEFLRLQRNLSALVEFSNAVNSSLDLSFTLSNLLYSTMGKFLATRGAILLREKDSLKAAASKGIDDVLIRDMLARIPPDQPELLQEECLKAGMSLLLPLEVSGKHLGYFLLGEKITKVPYSQDEIDFLRTVLNIASTAVQNALFITELKSVNKDLDARIARINSLFELGKEFGVLLDESRIGKLLLYSLLGNFLVSQYAILVLEEGKCHILETTIPRSSFADFCKIPDVYHLAAPAVLSETTLRLPEPVHTAFELIIPMRMRNQTRGIIFLGPRMNKLPYSPQDKEFITSLGSLAIMSLENRRLFKEAIEKQKMEEELELAKGIQRNLFPATLPSTKHFDIAAISISSRQVGGDYYDLIPLGEENYCAAIADVSGKGVPASLLMANLQAFLKSITKFDLPMDQATAMMNDLVSENTSDGRFITFFWTILNDRQKCLKYVNAGHNPPLLVRDNTISYLTEGGMIFGVMKTMFPYKMAEVNLQRGDVLVLFTDGVTEAKSVKDEEYSDERLEQLILKHAANTPQEIVDAILADLRVFTLNEPQSDDITLIVIKVK